MVHNDNACQVTAAYGTGIVTTTQNGYDTAMGTNSICWRSSLQEGNQTSPGLRLPELEDVASSSSSSSPLYYHHRYALDQSELVQDCWNGNLALTVQAPEEASVILGGERLRLRTNRSYEYSVDIEVDLGHLALQQQQQQQQLLISDQQGRTVGVQILLCAVGKVGFCSPFVHDEALVAVQRQRQRQRQPQPQPQKEHTSSMMPTSGGSHSNTHIDSGWVWLKLGESSARATGKIAISTTVAQPGEYFVIGSLQFFTTTANTPNSTKDDDVGDDAIIHRWDVANALPPQMGRVLEYQDPPVILQVSSGVQIFSYCAIGISSLILLFLIYQTVKHRNEQVLNLSQADFLVVFLVAALVGTVSAFLLEPTNDLYCQISFPMILISIQIMYSITLGRLWRINAVISPLLLEHFRKSMKNSQSGRLKIRFIGYLRYFARIRCCSGDNKRRNNQNKGMRRSVSPTRLALVIGYFAMPQIILQTCSLLLQPQQFIINLNEDESMGRATCSNGMVPVKNILTYSYVALIILILTLLIMAFSSRKLPSLFNETSVIYNNSFNTIVLMILGSVIIAVTNDTSTSPDVPYLVWIAVILSITLGSSLGLMLPKLRMVWKGETVVVSKLVSDHHRQKREKRRARGSGLSPNVTGMDFDMSESNVDYTKGGGTGTGSANVWGNGSFSNAEDLSNFELVTPSPGRRPAIDIPRRSSGKDTESDTLDGSSSFNLVPIPSNSDESPVPSGETTDIETGEVSDSKAPPTTGASPSMLEALSTPSLDQDEEQVSEPSLDKHDYMQKANHRIEQLRMKQKSSENALNQKIQSISPIEEDPFSAGRQSSAKNVNQVQGQRSAAASVADRRRHQMLKIQSSRAVTKIYVSPDETPARRLVLKLVDLQDDLTDLNSKVMSGLAVKTESWDSVVDLIARLEKHFREDVVFSWRPPPTRDTVETNNAMVGRENVANRQSESHDVGEDTSETDVARRGTRQMGANTHGKQMSLSCIAKEFKKLVDVRDRKYKMMTYSDAFIGSDAVDALVYAGLAESREDAVQLGRSLASELHLFKHVTGEHHFQDGYLFFRFVDEDDDSLSSFEEEPEAGPESMYLSDVLESGNESEARAFKEAVVVQDRRYRMKLYPKVFIGSEAVDALVYQGVAKTRWEAVQLGRKLVRELRIFKHVCGDHEFRDEYLFYHYREEALQGVSGSNSIGETSEEVSNVIPKRSPLVDKADAFEMYVDVRDRRSKMKLYKQCFIGSEAVDALIYAGLATTRQEAIEIGLTLQKELRLFRCVTGDLSFQDGHVFYRLRDDRNGAGLNQSQASSDIGSLDEQGDGSRISGTTMQTNLAEKADAFKQLVETSDRTYHMKTYRNVFVGCEAVDVIMYNGLARTRREAVQLGRALAREMNIFKHTMGHHAFCDDFLFYRFIVDDDSSINSNMNHSMSKSDVNSFGISELTPTRSRLAEQAEAFTDCLDIRDRKYHMKMYKSCFIGSEAVDAAVFSGVVQTREAAVELGRKLEQELRLFRHVTGDHPFCDDRLFYQVRDMNHRTSGSLDGESLAGSASRDDSSERSDTARKTEAFKRLVSPLVGVRKYYMKEYNAVFVGQEAVDALVYAGIAKTRKEAVQTARVIAKESDLFRHVTGEHAFCDDFLFYEFKHGDEESSDNHGAEDREESLRSVIERSELGAKADLVRGCVDVRERIFRMKKFKACFIGAEAVDAMVFSDIVKTRQEAVALGRTLCSELRLFRHVSGAHVFKDEYLFYRFKEDEDVSSSNRSVSTGDTGGGESRNPYVKLLDMANQFKDCIEVQNRRFRLRTFRQCFIGCETVDALVESGIVQTRKEAVEFGRTLARDFHLFHHVTGDHAFCDDYLFFRLRDHNNDSADQSISSYNSRLYGGDFGELHVLNEIEEHENENENEHEDTSEDGSELPAPCQTMSNVDTIDCPSSMEDERNHRLSLILEEGRSSEEQASSRSRDTITHR